MFVQSDGGYVYAMGSNSEGRLGTGATGNETRICKVPTLVDGIQNIVKVSCGTSHTLALSADGRVFAWGQSFYGALGITEQRSEQDNSPKPMVINNAYSPQQIS